MERISVPFQVIWFDYQVSDGTYTPAELRKAGLRVQRGTEKTYTLTWPGGMTQPPRPEMTRARAAGRQGEEGR